MKEAWVDALKHVPDERVPAICAAMDVVAALIGGGFAGEALVLALAAWCPTLSEPELRGAIALAWFGQRFARVGEALQ